MSVKALVIDDSPIIRRVLALVLRSQKIESRVALNGREALSILEKDSSIKLVLVDWSMPEMNGMEFLLEVRGHPAYDHLKLFVVTANDTQRATQQAMELGADDFIVKPISKKLVAAKLKQHGLN